MSLAVLQASVLQTNGALSVAAGAQITVRTPDGALATLYEDREGTTPTGANPVFADSKGFFRVYVEPGRYDVTVTTSSGAQVYDDIALFADGFAPGDAATADIGTTSGTVAAGDHLHEGVYEPADTVSEHSAETGGIHGIPEGERALHTADLGTATGTQTLAVALDQRVIWVDAIPDLQALSKSEFVDGQQFSVGSYLPNTSTGSALLRWRPDLSKSLHDGVLFFSLTVPMFEGTDTQNYRNGVGETDSGGDGVMELVRGEIIYDAIVRVPTHYNSWQESIEDLSSRVSPCAGVSITHRVNSGVEISEGVVLSGGNYSQHILDSEDAELQVADTFTGSVIRASDCITPTLSTIINANGLGSSGIMLTRSRCNVSPGCGVIFSGASGATIISGSYLYALESIFDDAATSGISVQLNSEASLTDCSAKRCGLSGLNLGSSSRATARDADFTYSGRNGTGEISAGILADRTSTVDARGADCRFAGNRGAWIDNGSTATLRSCNFSDSDGDGIFVARGAEIDINGAIINDVVGSGVNCQGVTIYANNVQILRAGFRGIRSEQCTVWARGVDIQDCADSGAFFGRGSHATLDGSCTGSGVSDVRISSGSIVSAVGLSTTNGSGSPDISDTNVDSFNTPFSNFGIIWA